MCSHTSLPALLFALCIVYADITFLSTLTWMFRVNMRR